MQGYRVYYDKDNKVWKHEDFLSEVNAASDFEHWNATAGGAQSTAEEYNASFVEKPEDMSEYNHYTICKCKECGEEYILNFGEYEWFVSRNLSVPKRCSSCRCKRRKDFTKGNSDDINAAVKGLDQFMKNWCMNCKATEENNDLVFRCNECNFQFDDGRCQIKNFVVDKLGDVPEDFGSMGSH